jgi:hypothetical protein
MRFLAVLIYTVESGLTPEPSGAIQHNNAKADIPKSTMKKSIHELGFFLITIRKGPVNLYILSQLPLLQAMSRYAIMLREMVAAIKNPSFTKSLRSQKSGMI